MPSRHAADIRQVPQKTGRTVEEWCALLESNGIGDRREAVNFLRDGHAVSHAFALTIAAHCLRQSTYEEDWADYGEDEEEAERW